METASPKVRMRVLITVLEELSVADEDVEQSCMVRDHKSLCSGEVDSMASKKEEAPGDVRLVVADVDGALVTPDKVITTRARSAVRNIIAAGIAFTITSGRPPRGMKMLIDALQLQDPITAFNGGLFLNPDLSVIRENLLPREAVQPVIDILTKQKLDVWIYSDKDWYVPSRHGPHVDREEW